MKNILITGGSRGIGAEMVKSLTALGHNVYFLYKSSFEAAQELSSQTGAKAIKCDVSSENDVRDAFQEIHSTCLYIDVLINNAGISDIKPFLDTKPDDWHKMMSVTLDGAYYNSRLAIKDMLKAGHGRIINISSMWGQVGASCEVSYSTAKAGLIGMTKALSKELAPSNITVNCVCPGFIDTEMNSHLTSSEKEEFINEIPLERAGTAKDVSNAVEFLISDSSSYITGQVIAVNGGLVV